MLFLHTLLFFALGTSIVSCDSDGVMNRELQRPLEVPGISRYADEWHRKPLTDVYGKNRNDVMEIMKDTGYMRFGYLNHVVGSRSVMSRGNEWVYRESRKRVLGTWRRMPKSTVSLEDRLALLDIQRKDGIINAQIQKVPIMFPKATFSISSLLKGPSNAEPLQDDAEGTWYRVLGDGSDDVIVIRRGKAPVLYRLDEFGETHHVRNSVRVKRLVGAWLRWPDVSSLFSNL
ncbi:hypothetical protein F5887DRAFT_98053 [Amanita rubescens]|nr:hypothetical protein F5887DRAFT_98053 [Amanita rubescens]